MTCKTKLMKYEIDLRKEKLKLSSRLYIKIYIIYHMNTQYTVPIILPYDPIIFTTENDFR